MIKPATCSHGDAAGGAPPVRGGEAADDAMLRGDAQAEELPGVCGKWRLQIFSFVGAERRFPLVHPESRIHPEKR